MNNVINKISKATNSAFENNNINSMKLLQII